MADVTISQLTQGVPSGNNILPYSTGSNTLGVSLSSLFKNTSEVDFLSKLSVSNSSINSNLSLEANYRGTNPGISTNAANKNLYIATNNSAGNLIFETNGSAAMTINNSGVVTKPLQPAFAVGAIQKSYTGTSPRLNSFELLQGINVGNSFNVNTGIFTCPVAGIYSISGMIRLDPGPSTYIYPDFIINNQSYYGIAGAGNVQPLPGLSISNNVNGFSTANFSLLIKLNQGDALQFGYVTPGNAQTTYTVYGQTCFYGYLLG